MNILKHEYALHNKYDELNFIIHNIFLAFLVLNTKSQKNLLNIIAATPFIEYITGCQYIVVKVPSDIKL